MRCGGDWKRNYGRTYPGAKGETLDTDKDRPADHRASPRPYQPPVVTAGCIVNNLRLRNPYIHWSMHMSKFGEMTAEKVPSTLKSLLDTVPRFWTQISKTPFTTEDYGFLCELRILFMGIGRNNFAYLNFHRSQRPQKRGTSVAPAIFAEKEKGPHHCKPLPSFIFLVRRQGDEPRANL